MDWRLEDWSFERGRIACKPKAARVAQIASCPAHIASSPNPLPAPPLLLVPLVLEAWVVVGGNASTFPEGAIGPAPPRRLLLLLEPLLPEVVLVDWDGLSVVLVGALTHVLVGGVAANVVGVVRVMPVAGIVGDASDSLPCQVDVFSFSSRAFAADMRPAAHLTLLLSTTSPASYAIRAKERKCNSRNVSFTVK